MAVKLVDIVRSINKTAYAICQRFYWPGQTDDIRIWIATCDKCQRVGPLEKKEPLQSIKRTLAHSAGDAIAKMQHRRQPLARGTNVSSAYAGSTQGAWTAHNQVSCA